MAEAGCESRSEVWCFLLTIHFHLSAFKISFVLKKKTEAVVIIATPD
jgi:hypothetical protein